MAQVIASRSFDQVLGGLVVACLVAGCSLFADQGSRIADDIRGQRSPLITRIEYGGDNDDSGPHLMVFLVEGSTREDGMHVACEVIWPAIERGKPPELLIFSVLDASGLIALATDLTRCP